MLVYLFTLILLFCQIINNVKSLHQSKKVFDFQKQMYNAEPPIPEFIKRLNNNEEQLQKTKSNSRNRFQHSKISFPVEFEKKTLWIDLSLKENLLSENYSISLFSKDGQKLVKRGKSKQECYHQGVVRAIRGSKVFADACAGFNGYVILPKDFLILVTYTNGTRVVSRPIQKRLNTAKSFCDAPHFNKENTLVKTSRKNNTQQQNILSKHLPIQVKNKKSFVELLVIVDKETYQRHGSISAVEDFVKRVVNIVDGFYRELNIRIILSYIEIWNNGNQMQLSSNSTMSLMRLKEYVFSKFLKNSQNSPWSTSEALHVLYGGRFNDRTLGIAIYNSMCSADSLGITANTMDAWRTAIIMTHEIGHTFGMLHNNYTCFCPRDKHCIMDATNVFNLPQTWSSCSKKKINEVLNSYFGRCLYNIPYNILDQPMCGNDVVEDNEDCDCGGPGYCFDGCCNPSTCKYNTEVECKKGECCHNCQFAGRDVKCREASGNCDLPDYCTGQSPFCPKDLYKQDGSPCSDENAFCYNNTCRTHKTQCVSLWGIGAVKAIDLCYEALNQRGLAIGNCGRDANGAYKKCQNEDVECGSLFCTGGRSFSTTYKATILNVTFEKAVYSCKGILLQKTRNASIDLNLGLVEDGTACGFQKICLANKCQKKTLSRCTETCNGNGVCNNLGECHCDTGWLPPFCNITFKKVKILETSDIKKRALSLLTLVFLAIGINLVLFCFGFCTGLRDNRIKISRSEASPSNSIMMQ